jgi:hypothetical protein
MPGNGIAMGYSKLPSPLDWQFASHKFRVSAHESIERESPIESTRIGEYPGWRPSELSRVSAPGDILLADDARKGALPEEGSRTWRVLPQFRPQTPAEPSETRLMRPQPLY